MLIQVPEVPPGSNPFTVYRAAITTVLFNAPSPGFETRLYVLWGLVVYCALISIVYLGVTVLDYRRRKKGFWVWRLVRRSEGSYVVGNQNVLFALLALVSSAVLIGYISNGRDTLLLHKAMGRAYYWRTLVWVPLVVHGWISSWSNFQAAILSSQRASNKHVLTPRIANALYIGVLSMILIVVITLDIYSAATWVKGWRTAVALRETLVQGEQAFDATNSTNLVIVAKAREELYKLADQLQFFSVTQRAVAAVYVLATGAIVALNIGGLSLLFTLHKQIQFNSHRFATPIVPVSLTDNAGLSNCVDNHSHHHSQSHDRPTSPIALPAIAVIHHRPSVDLERSDLLRKISFASPNPDESAPLSFDRGEKDKEKEGFNKQSFGLSIAKLKESAEDTTPEGVARQEQAKHLLMLRKIEWDLYVFVVVTVGLALMCMGVSFFLAISSVRIFKAWVTTELALFLVVWCYSIGVALSMSFLLYNAIRHLTRTNSSSPRKLASSIPIDSTSSSHSLHQRAYSRDDDFYPPSPTSGMGPQVTDAPPSGTEAYKMGILLTVETSVHTECGDEECEMRVSRRSRAATLREKAAAPTRIGGSRGRRPLHSHVFHPGDGDEVYRRVDNLL